MNSTEKVVKGLELCLASIDKATCPEECPYYETCRNYENRVVFQPVMRDALELLKEQPKIVRCKDCKHRPTYPKAYGAEINGNWCYWCELHRSWKTDDWFCADGERR